ncbi:MAG: hypothetical protein IT168_32105 [Bryobacterales bacterium]|nr:hypothetical protein [Bryobacterales bacterium]
MILLAVDSDFSGTWRLNADRSTLTLPHAAATVLQIEQRGSELRCKAELQGRAAEDCSFTVDRRERRLQNASATHNIMAKWEGDAIMANVLVVPNAGPQYTLMDRWSLSRDRNTLRIRRQMVSAAGEREAQLVYQREGALPAPPPPEAPEAVLPTPTALPSAPVFRPQPPSTPPQPKPPVITFVVERGSKLPLALVSSVSTRTANPGDRIYLKTVYPVAISGRIVIPPGSHVNGTVTEVKRPGRVKGQGELFIRFDSLLLNNGVTRDFRARVGSAEGQSSDKLARQEGRIGGGGNKSGDARTVGQTTAAGAGIGGVAGSIGGRAGMGAGIGAAAGAVAGLAGVLGSRGPEAQLPAGTIVEMVLDRDLTFSADELDGSVSP